MVPEVAHRSGKVGEGERRTVGFGEPGARFFVQVLAPQDLSRAVQGAQGQGSLPAGIGMAAVGKGLQDPVKFQRTEAAFVHGATQEAPAAGRKVAMQGTGKAVPGGQGRGPRLPALRMKRSRKT